MHEPRSESSAAKSKQTRTLCVLFSVLLVVIFRPALEAGTHLLFVHKSAPIRGHTFVAPRGWLVRERAGRFQLWKPCLTIFCSTAGGSITIGSSQVGGDSNAWHQAVLETLKDRGYSQPNEKIIVTGATSFTCLESTSLRRSDAIVSVCYDPAFDIQATFDGRRENVNQLYELIRDSRAR
jgi:hypothetical protein